MSETDSSDSDRVDVAPRSAGRACHGKNTRSLSWQPADDYYASACNTPNSSGANYYTEKDLPALENLHRELLADNFRLWECVNIVRCNPGLMASHVLKHLYSQEDHEFYASYPTYAQFRQSGHGALSSTAEGGGSRDPSRYVQHLTAHNNGLLRENARLLLCVEVLSEKPGSSADEVVCHCFGLSDDDFVRNFPSAARGSRLRAVLARLRDESKKHVRSRSLPVNIFERRVHPKTSSDASSGPSCSNNNDIFLRRTFSNNSPAHTRVDTVNSGTVKDTDRERAGDSSRPSKGPLDSLYVQGCKNVEENVHSRSTSPRRHLMSTLSRQSSQHQDVTACRQQRSKAKGFDRPRDRSAGDKPIPYMVSLHPYNWATSNNSSIHPSSPTEKDGRCRRELFLPDDNEEGGVLYRKNRAFRQLAHPLSVSGVGLENPKVKSSQQGPTISYSLSPAAQARNSQAKSPDVSEARNYTSRFNSAGSVGVRPASGRRSKLPVPSHGQGRANSSEARELGSKQTRERGSMASQSPRKATARQGAYSTLMANRRSQSPEKGRNEKSVTFQRHNADFTQTRKFHRNGSRSPSFSPRRRRFVTDDLTGKPKPMYYKPPSEKRENAVSGGESEEDEKSPSSPRSSSRGNRFTFSNGSPERRLSDVSRSLGSNEWSLLPSRLSRSLSGNLCLSGQEPYSVTRSRRELMELRDAFRGLDFAPSPEPRYSRTSTFSPDSLETSPVKIPASQLPLSLTSPFTRDKPTAADASVGQRRGTSFPSTNTSLPTIPGKAPQSTRPSHGGSSEKVRPGSPRRSLASATYPQTSTTASVSEKKTYRCPVYRRRLSPEVKGKRTQEWIKNTNTSRSGKTVSKLPPRCDTHKIENANSVPDFSSSLEFSGVSAKKDGFPFLKSLLEIPDDSILGKLLQEKRQLDLKYSSDKNYRRQSCSAPPSSWAANCLEGRGEPCSSSTETSVAGRSAVHSPKSSARSPRLSRKARRVCAEDDTVATDQATSAVSQLHTGMDRLREETDRCRLCRQRRFRSEDSMQDAFLNAYHNLGFPPCPAGEAMHHHSQENRNCNSATPAELDLGWKSILREEKDDRRDECSEGTKPDPDTLTTEAETPRRSFCDAPMTILGEVAFQLERRIIRQVFKGTKTSTSSDEGGDGQGMDETEERHRFYGYTVLNLPQKIRSDCRDSRSGRRDEAREACLMRRLQAVVAYLRDTFGYRVHKHGKLSQDVINKYGVFPQPPDAATVTRLGLHDFRSLRNHVIKLSNPQERPDMIVLVDCLHGLAVKENTPILCFN